MVSGDERVLQLAITRRLGLSAFSGIAVLEIAQGVAVIRQ
jgi:hypothetical protein